MTAAKNSTALTLKIIGTILVAASMLATTVWTGAKSLDDGKQYTDQAAKELRSEEQTDVKEIQKQLGQVHEDTAIMRTILEERFGKKNQ